MAHECSCRHESPATPGTAFATVGPETTVGDVIREQAGALEILKDMEINHCCGAHLTLREAAAAAGVSLDLLLAALAESRSASA